MESKNIAFFIGGNSPEHEVSVVTGLQAVEYLDRSKYNLFVIYFSESGEPKLLRGLEDRREFFDCERISVEFGQEKDRGYIHFSGQKVFLDCIVNCMHGGAGELGYIAGLLESLNIPYSSTNPESSAICMNKAISKRVASFRGVPTVESLSVLSVDIEANLEKIKKEILNKLSLPVIIKPVHLGSSIGIKIVKDEVDLELSLLEARFLDDEVLIEKFLSPIKEYNCSVRTFDGEIETSEIESPMTKDQILSFSEKYQKGGKKSGGGMASLRRELPAKISQEMRSKIEGYSKTIYKIFKCSGVVRIDYIESFGEIYFNEINPIPGSLSYYLWEAKGISFKQQLTDLVEESIKNFKKKSSMSFVHKTDIIKTFINNFKC